MTDGRWSVGIACSSTGDEEVILYDGQEVPAWDVVTILNSRDETESAPSEKTDISKTLHDITAVVLACSKAAEHSARALEAVTGYLQQIDERMEAFQRNSWERANRERGLDDD